MKYMIQSFQIFFNSSPLRKLSQQGIVTASASLFTRIIGFSKEIVIASIFGLSGQLDIFVYAFVLISFPFAFISAIQTIFVTSITSEKDFTKHALLLGETLVNSIIYMLFILFLWLAILPYVLPLISGELTSQKENQTISAVYTLTPYYLLTCISALNYSMLQAKGKFLAYGLFPAAHSIIFIICLLFFGIPEWETLTFALTAGVFMEVILTFYLLVKENLIRWPTRLFSSFFRTLYIKSVYLLPAVFITSFIPLYEQSIAATLAEGSNAALRYGIQLPTAIQGLFAATVATILLPYFSSLIAEKKYDYCKHSFQKLLYLLTAISLPIVLVLGFFSAEITSLIYQRGEFDSANVARVAPLQAIYFLQLPFSIILIISTRMLNALEQNKLLSIVLVVSGIIHCLGVYLLSRLYEIEGIAATTLITTFFTAIVLTIYAKKNLEIHRVTTI